MKEIGVLIASVCCAASVVFGQQQSSAGDVSSSSTSAAPTSGARTFSSPQEAANALVSAAGVFDEHELIALFGTGGDDIVLTGEYAQDRQRAAAFAAEAKEKQKVSVDPNNPNRAWLIVGNENWPFPVPIMKSDAGWAFDAKAGRQELLYRRVGSNELDAIQVCRNYVAAQQAFALEKRQGYDVHQYAQRIISTAGKQDGLVWRNADSTWGGPLAEEVAAAIQQGYTSGTAPYHGYLFKMLKGQGPAAPMGELDFVIEGVMIGGFALVAAPAEYRITGVKTFIVSHDGVVYQKDLGPSSLDEFKRLERFNPDESWTPVPARDEQ